MSLSKFEELEVYRLAEKLSDMVWDIVIRWKLFPKNTMGVQLVDASDSIGSNIAEGYGRESYADRARFAKISRGSLFETKHWLNKSFRRKLIPREKKEEFDKILDILLPKISAYISYLNEHANSKKSK
jgi:four helix bundle protein